MDPQWTHIHPDGMISVFLLVEWENDTIHPGILAASITKKENVELMVTWSRVALGFSRNGHKRSDVTGEWGCGLPRQLLEEGPEQSAGKDQGFSRKEKPMAR